MKQIIFHQFGQPSHVAKCVDVPEIESPSPWEVVVDIEAFPINPADLAMMAGQYGTLPKLPAAIGMEGVGIISQIGNSVKDLSVGDRVLMLANNNWVEKRKVPSATVHKIPKSIAMEQAAMLKVNPVTAFMLLNRFVSLKPGDWIIQSAPLSSVGQCITQIARSMDVNVIHVARTERSLNRLKNLGEKYCLLDGDDMHTALKEWTKSRSPKIAFDAVGGKTTNRLALGLAEQGTVVNYGMLSGEPCELSPDQTIFRGISLCGFWLSKILNRLSLEERSQLFTQMIRFLELDTIRFEIDSVFSMDQIEAALKKAETTQRTGKILVIPGQNGSEALSKRTTA